MDTPRIEHADVTREGDDSLVVSWSVAPAGHPVSVYRSDRGAGKGGDCRLVVSGITDDRVRLDASRRRRVYFQLRPEGGTQSIVAERVLPLNGARNFRDIGGYPSRAGGRVRWGVLYRSDYLSHLTDEDVEHLHEVGIRTVFDLRGNIERENHPSRWHPDSEVDTVSWDDASDLATLGLRMEAYRERIAKSNAADMRGYLRSHYRRYVDIQAEKYRGMLDRLAGKTTAPALIHCTAGKDRTGLGVALLLHLLGVDEECIYEDYLLTNESSGTGATRERIELLLRQYGMDRAGEGALEALLMAHREYLEAAFQGMRDEYGSINEYSRKRLGVTGEARDRLRELYLD